MSLCAHAVPRSGQRRRGGWYFANMASHRPKRSSRSYSLHGTPYSRLFPRCSASAGGGLHLSRSTAAHLAADAVVAAERVPLWSESDIDRDDLSGVESAALNSWWAAVPCRLGPPTKLGAAHTQRPPAGTRGHTPRPALPRSAPHPQPSDLLSPPVLCPGPSLPQTLWRAPLPPATPHSPSPRTSCRTMARPPMWSTRYDVALSMGARMWVQGAPNEGTAWGGMGVMLG